MDPIDLAATDDCHALQGKSWKARNPEDAQAIREMLVRRGGIEDRELRNPHERWRIRIEKVVFTAYKTGTIYCNGGSIPELAFLYKSIEQILGQTEVS